MRAHFFFALGISSTPDIGSFSKQVAAILHVEMLLSRISFVQIDNTCVLKRVDVEQRMKYIAIGQQ